MALRVLGPQICMNDAVDGLNLMMVCNCQKHPVLSISMLILSGLVLCTNTSTVWFECQNKLAVIICNDNLSFFYFSACELVM